MLLLEDLQILLRRLADDERRFLDAVHKLLRVAGAIQERLFPAAFEEDEVRPQQAGFEVAAGHEIDAIALAVSNA